MAWLGLRFRLELRLRFTVSVRVKVSVTVTVRVTVTVVVGIMDSVLGLGSGVEFKFACHLKRVESGDHVMLMILYVIHASLGLSDQAVPH